MPKDRRQMTPENPEDWAKIQSGRGQGTGGTGYDRLPGEQARPGLRDNDPAAETIPEPLYSLASDATLSPAEIEAQEEAAWEAHEKLAVDEPEAVIERLKTLSATIASLTKQAGSAVGKITTEVTIRVRHFLQQRKA